MSENKWQLCVDIRVAFRDRHKKERVTVKNGRIADILALRIVTISVDGMKHTVSKISDAWKHDEWKKKNNKELD